ncbi:MAG: pyridoxal phosphate-dependent aminotransferase [Thermoleophilia bacterium]|nr:pyridoxal phosphate-dependent aminotransferase [Thermoleophilia bacterium]
MTLGRFPTYAAEERLRGLGLAPPPLHGTAAPGLPPHVVDAVAEAISRPMATPPARGLEPLRHALAVELARTTGRAVDPASELLVTNGAMQALGVVFRSLLEPGDEVVVPAPCFFFEGPIRAAGARPVYVPAPDGSRRWDAEAIEAAIGPAARALLLCNPENPTGHVPGAREVAAVVEVAGRHGLQVVTDEAYEGSLWDGAELASAFAAADDAIVVRSLGKSLSMPHLRVGLVAGSAAAVEACARTLEWDCLRVGVAAQTAALAALDGPRTWLAEVREGMARSREAALGAVAGVEGLVVEPPLGGPFLFLAAADGRETLADELLTVGLPVVDGRHFQAPGWARLPFGGAADLLPALEAALQQWASNGR